MKMTGNINFIEKGNYFRLYHCINNLDFQYTYITCHIHELHFDNARYESLSFGCNICGISSHVCLLLKTRCWVNSDCKSTEPCWQCNTCQFDAHAQCTMNYVVPKPLLGMTTRWFLAWFNLPSWLCSLHCLPCSPSVRTCFAWKWQM
jgi:hypothetical protein